MAAQLDYGFDIPKGVPGGLANLTHHEVISRRNEEATGKMKQGFGVVEGTTPGKTAKLPTATGDKFAGIVLHVHNTEMDMEGVSTIKKDASLSVMKHGEAWVRLATDVEPAYGDKAYLVVTGADAGCFTKTADGAIEVGKFISEADNGIAVVQL